MPLLRMIAHEARQVASDRTLVCALVVLAVAVGYGLTNGASWVAAQRRVLAEVAREDETRRDSLQAQVAAAGGDRGVAADQVGLASGTRHASLQPGLLAALIVGRGDLDPSHVLVTTATRPATRGEDEIENPTHLLTGRFDLGFVIVAIYPLVILALSYNLLAAEREQGTLLLILSQPVRLATLVLAKVVARGAAVLGLAIVLSLVGSAAASGATWVDDSARLGLWVAVVVAYGAFWFALAVAVDAMGGGSARNALVLAGSWLVVVAIIPAVLNVIVRAAYPVPSRVELTQAIRSASDRARAEGPQLRATFLEAHPELVRGAGQAQEFAVQSLAVQEATEAGIAGVLGRFEEQLGRQQRLVDRFRFASPAIATLEALQDAAGTGPARFGRFAGQVEAFRSQWRDYFRPKIVRGEPIRAGDLDQLPAFTYREESLPAVAGRVAVGLIGIAVPTVVVGLLGVRALRRFPVVG